VHNRSVVVRYLMAAAVVIFFGAALLVPAAGAQTNDPVVTEIRLDGVVDPFIAGYIADEIGAAQDRGDDALLLTIDTPGGLDSSMRTIVQAILNSKVPVICYVSPEGARAASAGTFILLSCSAAAMAPGTNVGAAHPVGISGAIESDKAENDAAAYIRSIAEERGRNDDWAESAVRDSVSISAEEAESIDVIDLISPDIETLLSSLDGREVGIADGANVSLNTADAALEKSTPGLGTRILHTLLGPNFAFIFFYLGLGLIIVEFLHPGISLPGIAGGLSLIVSFSSIGMLPFQIIGVALLIASIIFLILELQAPGPGIFTAGAIVSLVFGGLLLFDPGIPSARVSILTIVPVAGLLLLFLITIVPAAQRVRRMPKEMDSARLLGETGVVTEALNPEGVVLVASESWTASSEGQHLPRDTRIFVTGVSGLKLKVEPVSEEKASVIATEQEEGSK
jgi:membrane-bound serine protease (ClpP class)